MLRKQNLVLKILVMESGLEAKYIAQRIGIHPVTFSGMCNGRRLVPERYIPQLSKLLNVSEKKLKDELNVIGEV